MNENAIEGRNAVIEAFRAGKTIDRLYVQEGVKDGPVQTVLREAKKQKVKVDFVTRERLNQLSSTGRHQGVIAIAASYSYAEVEDILEKAREKNEDPFIILLDGIEDPYNSRGDHPHSKPGRSPRGHYSQKPRRRTDCQCSPDLRGGAELHTGGKGDQPAAHHGRPQKAGGLVCLR